MSTVIEELKLKNFEGYKNADLKFSSGLNLINGRNSTGKSTLLDALVFALFGEAPDVKPKLLVSRLPDAGEMAVYVKFRSPMKSEIVEVTRKGKLDAKGGFKASERLLHVNRKEIHLESDEDLRSRITKLMGVTFRKFINLVYVKQGKLSAILDPQKEQMDSIIGISLLRELREQLDEVRRNLEKYEGRDVQTESQNLEKLIIPQLRLNIDQLKKDIERLQGETEKLRDLVKKGESPELTELLKNIGEKEELIEKIGELQAKSQELLKNAGVNSHDEIEPKIKSWQGQLQKLKESRNNLSKEVNEHLEAWSDVKGKADALDDEIREHESLLKKKIPKCPTCGQDLKPSILKKILKNNKAELQQLRVKEADSKRIYETKKSALDELGEKLIILTNNIEALESIEENLKKYFNSTSSLQNNIEKHVQAIQDILKKLNLPLQPEDPELKIKVAEQLPIRPEELEARRKDLKDKQIILEGKVKDKELLEGKLKTSEELLEKMKQRAEKAKIASNLSKGFDQAVEARRKDFLKRIEFKALIYYKTMTDQHVYSAIKIDPEEYAVYVHPKSLTEAIPAARVGGGHQTLLALAVRLALLDALGFRSLLILDEPTYGVDSENLPQLASYISEASKTLSQTILVTHHNICEEEASSIIGVVRQEDGTSKAEVAS